MVELKEMPIRAKEQSTVKSSGDVSDVIKSGNNGRI